VFKRAFQTRTLERDISTDQSRQKRLLAALKLEISACQTENEGLSLRMKTARSESVLLLHALESQPNPSLEKRLREQETSLMICERRLQHLEKQAAFLNQMKNILEASFPIPSPDEA
jgi:hypothetical protein